jgi:AcrR family transcriptional regulator
MSKGQHIRITGLAKAVGAASGRSENGIGRRERRAAETRVRLFRCALQLIAERGYTNVTVEDITEAADVGKGTFFNYFETKDHVLGVMAEIQLSKVREAASLAGEGKQKIQSVLHRLVMLLAEEPGHSPALARAMISSFLASEGVRAIIDRNMREGRKAIAEIVAAGQERGEIDEKLKKNKIAIQLQQMNCILRTAVLIMLASLSSSEAGFAQQTPYRLTLQGAIQKALQANLNVLVAGTRVDEAQGTRERRLSAALLPRVTAQTYANYQNRDLRAFGISLPPIPGFAGLPSVVGPFSNYDFSVYAQQNVVDLESYRGFKASERALDAGKMDERMRAI